jgi:hypothetical protein
VTWPRSTTRKYLDGWEGLVLPVRVDALRLRAETDIGSFGFDASFAGNVTVGRGANTVGKSLLAQSILYGLGLDDLFATQQGTLTRAMTSELDTPTGRARVLRSEVWLQFSVSGQVFTTHRLVRTEDGRPDNSHQLVGVWHEAALTGAEPIESLSEPSYYFANRRGAAEAERGFHAFLADLLGLELPNVPNYNDSETRLYIQVVFGLCYVDQKRGWGGTVPQVPTKYRIIEPLRRAVEFVLQLDVLETLARRRALDDVIRRIEGEEKHLRGRLEASASTNGARLVMPQLPNRNARTVATIQEGYDPSMQPEFQILSSENWVPLDDRIAELEQNRVNRARAAADAQSVAAKAHIPELERRLGDTQAAAKSVALQLRSIDEAEAMLDTAAALRDLIMLLGLRGGAVCVGGTSGSGLGGGVATSSSAGGARCCAACGCAGCTGV